MTVTPNDRFRVLHAQGFFVMPNPWDVGSAVRLERLGFPALGTTSSGHAASMGRPDHGVTFGELCDHVSALIGAVDVPVSVDGGRLFAATPDGIGTYVDTLASLGASGISIEDYDPESGQIYPLQTASLRVRAAATAANVHDLTLTARADNHFQGIDDLDDTIRRLLAYRDAGADVLYAPGLRTLASIQRVIEEVGNPINVLVTRGGPTVEQLRQAGVRRVSTGGELAARAYASLDVAANDLLAVNARPEGATE